MATRYELVDVTDPQSEATTATHWWTRLTASCEGMVIKPLDLFARGPLGLVQPAVKCRGGESSVSSTAQNAMLRTVYRAFVAAAPTTNGRWR